MASQRLEAGGKQFCGRFDGRRSTAINVVCLQDPNGPYLPAQHALERRMTHFHRALITATFAVAALAAPAALAQAPADPTIYVVTYIEVMPAATAEAAGLLKQVAAASRKETGSQRYDILGR